MDEDEASEEEGGIFPSANRVSSMISGGISSLLGQDQDDDGAGAGKDGGAGGDRNDQFFEAMRQKRKEDDAAVERQRAETRSAMSEAERDAHDADEAQKEKHESDKSSMLNKQMGAFAGRGASPYWAVAPTCSTSG